MGLYPRESLKTVANLFGIGLGFAGLWYLVVFLRDVNFRGQRLDFDAAQIFSLVAFTTILTAANSLIAIGWRAILADFGGSVSLGRAQLLFGQSNLLKYVPGNILHLAGRQVLAMREGVLGWVATKSLVLEAILLVFAAAAFAGGMRLVTRFSGFAAFLLLVVLILILAACVLVLKHAGLRGSALATLGYCVYHLIGGLIFASLFALLGAPAESWGRYGLIATAYVASWILGMLTPGAPAGLGVREAVLIGLLQHSVADQEVLAAAVLLARAMSMTADGVYFVAVQGWSIGHANIGLRRR